MTELILASASRVRATILRNAGLTFKVKPSGVDEEEVKARLAKHPAADVEPGYEIAQTLAMKKACEISRHHPDSFVIGADQVLVCEGTCFDKPRDMVEAKSHLQRLQGRTHELASGTAIVFGGTRVWQRLDGPKLTMRSLSDDFIDTYLERTGQQALESVGAYQLEGLGAQLFSHVEGDFFTVLGLPLLPILDYLRAQTGMSI